MWIYIAHQSVSQLINQSYNTPLIPLRQSHMDTLSLKTQAQKYSGQRQRKIHMHIYQGDHSFSTMIFHDFSMTLYYQKNEIP